MYDLIVIDTEIQDINKNIDCFQKENNQWVIKNKKIRQNMAPLFCQFLTCKNIISEYLMFSTDLDLII